MGINRVEVQETRNIIGFDLRAFPAVLMSFLPKDG